MTQLKPETLKQIEKEAKLKYSESRRYPYIDGCQQYALRLQAAEEMMEKMAKELKSIVSAKEINELSLRLSLNQMIHTYNTYKQQKDGTAKNRL